MNQRGPKQLPRGRRAVPRSAGLPQRADRLDRRGLGMVGHCAVYLLTAVIAIAAIFGVMVVRLTHGPISVKFIAASIEKGINAELTGLTARIDDAVLAFSDGGGIELRLANLRLAEPDGDVVVSVPTAAVELSRPALWAMKLVPSRIDLIEARLSLTYSNEQGLALSFAADGADGRHDPAATVAPAAPVQNAERLSEIAKPRRVDLAAMISEATTRARQRLDGSSYLNQIGVRDCVVLLDNLGVRSEWRVLDGVIEIDHRKKRSMVQAHATVASDRGPWTIALRSEDSEKSQSLVLEAAVRDLVPRTLGLAVPQLALLESLDVPVNADATLDLAISGQVTSGKLAIAVGRGQFLLPEVGEVPFAIDNGQIGLTFDGATNRFELTPSTLAWGNSRVALIGSAVADTKAGAQGWQVDLATAGGQLTAEEFGVPAVAIEQGVIKGRIFPSAGEVLIDQLTFKAAGSQFTGSGQFMAAPISGGGGAKFDASIGISTADTLKVLWPRTLASGGRTWVGERIKRGTLKNGALHFVSGSFAKEGSILGKDGRPRRLTLAMEAADISALPLRWLSPVEAPRALIRLENNTLEITVPDASVVVSSTKRIPVKAGRFAVSNLEVDPSDAEITFKSLSPLVPVLDVLDQSPLHLLRANGVTTEGVDGKLEGQMKLTFPLIADLDAKAIKIEAKARVFDGRVKQLGGVADVQGATIVVDVSDVAVGVTGDLLANGVPVKLGWQHILEENGEKQPPLRLSATLDNADRTQLGIDVNHILQGEVPVEILIEKGSAEDQSIRLRADLTNADIALDSIAWHKPPGRAVSLGADIVKGKVHKIELQNLKVVGDDIAIEGMLGIGADNKLREVNLPTVSLNVVTRVDVTANLKSDGAADKTGVWQVRVRGQNFDGRDLFRSMFAVGPGGTDKAAKPQKETAGIDIDAEIDNVIGHGEVSLRSLKLKLSRRADKISFLEARGTLDGGAPVAFSMIPEAGQPRRLLADTTDAGQAFKLIGFYPNMQLGRARLEVNVDGRGPAEKTGIVWVEDFRILGDPVVAEVLGGTPAPGDEASAPSAGPRGKKRGPQREVFEFDRMKVPFSVGYGQFVIENAYLRGPLLGVNLVGKADFKLKSLNLGGTYIPLQGLNNALGEVPLLGALVSGPKGDGTFGITFAVQGPMAQPQVLVNPLSIVAPGIFREMFQMTNPNPKVIPRDEKGPTAPVEKRVRSSSQAPGEPERAVKPSAEKGTASGDAIDGWASQTSPAGKARKP